MKGFRYLDGVTSLHFDADVCIGCGMCRQVCPHQVFDVEKKSVRIKDIDACMECGACMRNCPVSALDVNAGVGCATGIIESWLKENKLSISSKNCCS